MDYSKKHEQQQHELIRMHYNNIEHTYICIYNEFMRTHWLATAAGSVKNLQATAITITTTTHIQQGNLDSVWRQENNKHNNAVYVAKNDKSNHINHYNNKKQKMEQQRKQ